jgi:hypothetical protein
MSTGTGHAENDAQTTWSMAPTHRPSVRGFRSPSRANRLASEAPHGWIWVHLVSAGGPTSELAFIRTEFELRNGSLIGYFL